MVLTSSITMGTACDGWMDGCNAPKVIGHAVNAKTSTLLGGLHAIVVAPLNHKVEEAGKSLLFCAAPSATECVLTPGHVTNSVMYM